MHATSKTHVSVRDLVLFARSQVTVGIKCIGVGKGALHSHRDGWAHNNKIPLGNRVGLPFRLDGNILLRPSQDHDKSGTQTQCFPHGVVQQFHLVQIVVL